MTVGSVMPDVSRAIRRREFDTARSLLSEVIDDDDEVARVLTVLIRTEPPPPIEGLDGPHFRMSSSAGERDVPISLVEATTDHRRGERFLDVLELMADGADRAEVADVLHLTLETVKTHLRRAAKVLETRSTTQSVAEAIRRGMIA